jgi:hypothetical protein
MKSFEHNSIHNSTEKTNENKTFSNPSSCYNNDEGLIASSKISEVHSIDDVGNFGSCKKRTIVDILRLNNVFSVHSSNSNTESSTKIPISNLENPKKSNELNPEHSKRKPFSVKSLAHLLMKDKKYAGGFPSNEELISTLPHMTLGISCDVSSICSEIAHGHVLLTSHRIIFVEDPNNPKSFNSEYFDALGPRKVISFPHNQVSTVRVRHQWKAQDNCVVLELLPALDSLVYSIIADLADIEPLEIENYTRSRFKHLKKTDQLRWWRDVILWLKTENKFDLGYNNDSIQVEFSYLHDLKRLVSDIL